MAYTPTQKSYQKSKQVAAVLKAPKTKESQEIIAEKKAKARRK